LSWKQSLIEMQENDMYIRFKVVRSYASGRYVHQVVLFYTSFYWLTLVSLVLFCGACRLNCFINKQHVSNNFITY
jgi:hypothetical protein